MQLGKFNILLLALLVAAMVMVPCVSAVEEQQVNLSNSGNLDISKKPTPHYIPDDYLKDLKTRKMAS